VGYAIETKFSVGDQVYGVVPVTALGLFDEELAGILKGMERGWAYTFAFTIQRIIIEIDGPKRARVAYFVDARGSSIDISEGDAFALRDEAIREANERNARMMVKLTFDAIEGVTDTTYSKHVATEELKEAIRRGDFERVDGTALCRECLVAYNRHPEIDGMDTFHTACGERAVKR
jgi:hypothetical protein